MTHQILGFLIGTVMGLGAGLGLAARFYHRFAMKFVKSILPGDERHQEWLKCQFTAFYGDKWKD